MREKWSEPSSSVGIVTVEAAGVPLLAGLRYFPLPPWPDRLFQLLGAPSAGGNFAESPPPCAVQQYFSLHTGRCTCLVPEHVSKCQICDFAALILLMFTAVIIKWPWTFCTRTIKPHFVTSLSTQSRQLTSPKLVQLLYFTPLQVSKDAHNCQSYDMTFK